MKIQDNNKGILIYTSLLAAFHVFAIAKYVTTHVVTLQGILNILFFTLLFIYMYLAMFKGTCIEINKNLLIRSEGFLKKKFNVENITRIYCAHHVFLGPSMFVEYKGKEKKLLVLNHYRQENKKLLLDFLAEKYPNIQQDHNCGKIRNGEKVLTTWKDK
jgi:hypothetical protein